MDDLARTPSLDQFMANEAITKYGLAEQVYETLLRKIVQRELPSGTRFTLRDTAHSLKVSMTPVRDAMLRLQIEGFVAVGPRGWMIPDLTVASVQEVFEAREMIEVFTASQATRRASEAEIGQLARTIPEMEAIFAAGACTDPSRYWELNSRLHQSIVRLAHNQRLTVLYDQLHVFALLRRLRALPDGGVGSVDCQEHRAIVAALCARDTEILENTLRSHLRGAHAALIQRMTDSAAGPGIVVDCQNLAPDGARASNSDGYPPVRITTT